MRYYCMVNDGIYGKSIKYLINKKCGILRNNDEIRICC